jgi:hypothetical protein
MSRENSENLALQLSQLMGEDSQFPIMDSDKSSQSGSTSESKSSKAKKVITQNNNSS